MPLPGYAYDPKRFTLPSPGRNWAGADRPQPFSFLNQVCLNLPVLRRQSLAGPRVQA